MQSFELNTCNFIESIMEYIDLPPLVQIFEKLSKYFRQRQGMCVGEKIETSLCTHSLRLKLYALCEIQLFPWFYSEMKGPHSSNRLFSTLKSILTTKGDWGLVNMFKKVFSLANFSIDDPFKMTYIRNISSDFI